jgi:hypothetical protein
MKLLLNLNIEDIVLERRLNNDIALTTRYRDTNGKVTS